MKTPVRTCAGCGARRPKSEMIRVGESADGGLAISGAGKQSGRGAYLCTDGGCLAKAKKGGGIARALRRKVPDRLYEELEIEIESRRKVSVG
jgi:predicted RNA-binding protein YlxR (DUF448 family)